MGDINDLTGSPYDLSLVRRALGTRQRDSGEAVVATISRTYPTTVDDLWDACTSPERLPRWFLPVTGELKLGGHYQLQGNAGGTIERCDPPHTFAATWEYGGEVSWIEVAITAEGDAARLTLEHIAHAKPEFWEQYGPGATGVGWDMMLNGLAVHIAIDGAHIDRAAAEAWSLSPDGVRFATESSAAWCAASIAFGTDPEQARAAADRTTAFYTTPPPAPES